VSRSGIVFVLTTVLANTGFCQQTVKTADADCAKCHAEIYRQYLATPMANASGPAVDHLFAGDFTHAPSGVRYKVFREQNQAWLSFNDVHDPRIAGKRRFDYFLGSGHLGATYLYTQEGYLLESPVAWYAATAGYDMKPGFGRMTEMPPALPTEPSCLRCHMSGVAHAQPGTINRYTGLPFQQTGITCEGCHGDTSAHVRTAGKASVVNPARLSAERRDSLCLSCHLEGDVSVERALRSALDYRPGDRISDYLSFFVFAGKDSLSRGVSEVEQLSTSDCKRASGDRMSCTSCHDPHRSPEAAERVPYYRAKCLNCHSAPEFAGTHHPETPDCASCHMPRSAAQNIPHVAWTDHRILRRPELAPMRPQGDGPLIAVFSPQVDQRDAAVAGYQAVVRGKSRDREAAMEKLKQIYAAGARDPQVLEGLGVLAGLAGDSTESERRFRELLEVQPSDLTALSDLGVLLARQGNIQAAIATWQPAFARNEDVIGLARNLAAAYCRAGDDASAREAMADALRFSPGVRTAWSFSCRTK
jgi:predicted CXXCH cytochrome family protein